MATPAEELERRIGLSAPQLRALVGDLWAPRAPTYWADMLASCAVGYGAFVLAVTLAVPPALQACTLLISAAALYRASLFTHELVHLPVEGFRAFRLAWNLLCGVPMLVPAFLYEVHPIHHDRRTYGTAQDGEYRPFASSPLTDAIGSVVAAPLAVPVLVLRFLVLVPLGWLIPPFRRLVLERASALIIDFGATRKLPPRLPWHWLLQETACFAYCACVLALSLRGLVSTDILWRGYLVITLVIFANALRVLCAHRYRSRGASMSFVEQVLDSNNFPRGFAAVWAPLGLRYHAVHHLFPTLPYHALGEAYRRLMQAVPAGSDFRKTSRSSLVSAVRDVLGGRRSAMRAAHEG